MKQNCKDNFLNEFSSVLFTIALGFGTLYIGASIITILQYAQELKNNLKPNKIYSDFINNILKSSGWKVWILEEDNNIPIAFCMHSKDIYISKTLIKILTKRELESILLHEAYHIKNYHTFKTIFSSFPFFVSALTVYFHVSALSIFLFPVILLAFTTIDEIPLRLFLFRKQELNADSYAVKYGYAKEMASSLTKLTKIVETISTNKECGKICRIMKRLDEAIDTHPPLQKRIENILKSKKTYAVALILNKSVNLSKEKIEEYISQI